MSLTDPEILEEFVVESVEHLTDVENQLLQIEEDGENIDDNLVNTVFRAVHSVKGVSGFLGFDNISSLAHRLENVLNLIRNRQLVPIKSIIDRMLSAADDLKKMIGDAEVSNEADISEHLSWLDEILASANTHTANAPFVPPAVTSAPPKPAPAEPTATAEDQQVSNEPTSPVLVNKKSTVVEKLTKPERVPLRPGTNPTENYIRVSVNTLDQMMNLAGELVLNRNRLLQFVGSCQDSRIESVSAGIDQVTSKLQEAVMQTRMQPVGTVFSRFRRIVRDLSAKLGKNCELDIEGSDVEVDKSVIEAIGDPLTHLIRNSVDHGVELPSVRAKRGKRTKARIRLAAYHQGGKVRIDIDDDGGGIDTKRLIESVVSRNLMTVEEAEELSEREAMELVFHPGLSTAAAVTELSGRGVGMDVVRTNIEKFGGSVEIESEHLQGTTIRIVLPLTLAIVPSLIVSFGKQFFAIPQVNIRELVRVPMEERNDRIKTIKGVEVLRLRGELLPLIRMAEALRLKDPPVPYDAKLEIQPTNIVILESGQTRYGLVVQNMEDSEEIVVKPLGRHLKSCPSYAGATILGDGHIALILDIAGIASKAHITSSKAKESEPDFDPKLERLDQQSLLLFANHPSEQFAIPMGLVSRIERVRADQVELIGNQEVIKYRDGILPLMRVEQAISSMPTEMNNKLNVIVIALAHREVGLVASEIRDIKDVAMNLDPASLPERGVMGTLVINKVATRILEILDMVRTVHPIWIPEQEFCTNSHRTGRTKKILFSEDSTFFRNYLGNYLIELGYDVVDVENGFIAWEYLLKHHDEVGLVLTDIEMPALNGFELCQRIRQTPNVQHLPVIALSALADDDALRRARQVGFDDYLVKVDRGKLCESIKQLMSKSNDHHCQVLELAEV